MKIINLFNRIGGSEVPGFLWEVISTSLDSYIVLSRPERLTERFLIKKLNYGRHLRSGFDGIFKNSGLPEVRKYRGNGGIVVFHLHWRGKKDSSALAVGSSLLSGSYASTELKKLFQSVTPTPATNGPRDDNLPPGGLALSSIMSDPQFLIACWRYLQGNQSRRCWASPPFRPFSFQGTTLRGEWFQKTSREIRNGVFQFQPSQTGGHKIGPQRPLTFEDSQDFILLEAMRYLLEIVFGAPTQWPLHRPSYPGCPLLVPRGHSALNHIKMTFGSANWFLKGDLSTILENVNHHKLIEIIERRVRDQSFIDLLWKALRAGYGPSSLSFLGAPPSRMIRPSIDGLPAILPYICLGNERELGPAMRLSFLLSHIYLTAFDKALVGGPRLGRASFLDGLEATPSSTMQDNPLGRLLYVRYAGEFLVGVRGSKAHCLQVRNHIAQILPKELGLELLSHKGVSEIPISHAIHDGADFLGYHIHLPGHRPSNRLGTRLTPQPILDAPTEKVVQKLIVANYARAPNGQPTRNGPLTHLQPYDIVAYYTHLERSLIQYYSLANNYGSFVARVHYILKYSCALTLASKLRLITLRNTFKKFGSQLEVVHNDGVKRISYPTPPLSRSTSLSRSLNT